MWYEKKMFWNLNGFNLVYASYNFQINAQIYNTKYSPKHADTCFK